MQARARLCSAACNCFLWGLHAQTARRSGFPSMQAGILRSFCMLRVTFRSALFNSRQRSPFKGRSKRSTVSQHCLCHEDRKRERHQQRMPIEDPGCVSGVCSGADCCECQTSKIFEHPHRDQDKRCKFTSSRQPSEPPWRRGTQEGLRNATIFVLIDCHPCWCYTSEATRCSALLNRSVSACTAVLRPTECCLARMRGYPGIPATLVL